MSKPPLAEPQRTLEQQLIESMTAGLHQWRPDLNYPESYSDMQGCARGILQMFTVSRAPLPIPLQYFEGTHVEVRKENGQILCNFCPNPHSMRFNNVNVCTDCYDKLSR